MTTTQTTKPTFKNILKKSLFILLGVIALLLIAAIFLPKKITTTVETKIDAPKTYVYNLLNRQSNVSLWNDWVISDEDIKLEFNEVKEGAGSGYSWHSESMGNGSIQYIEAMPNEKIAAELSMGEGDKSQYSYTFTEKEGKTILAWNFEANLDYPSNILGPLYKYMMKKSFNKSFDHMKAELLKRKSGLYAGYQVKEESQNPKHFISSRSVVKFENINQYYQQHLAAIYQKLQDNGISTVNFPASLFYTYDDKNKQTDMAVAVQILNPVNIKDLSSQSMPAQNTVCIDFYGDFSLTGTAHEAIEAYMKDRKLPVKLPVIEEYVTDPLKEKDVKKWLTKIYYYIGDTK